MSDNEAKQTALDRLIHNVTTHCYGLHDVGVAAKAELAAMRDELERVKGDINGLIADRDKYKDAADALESQAGATAKELQELKSKCNCQ